MKYAATTLTAVVVLVATIIAAIVWKDGGGAVRAGSGDGTVSQRYARVTLFVARSALHLCSLGSISDSSTFISTPRNYSHRAIPSFVAA